MPLPHGAWTEIPRINIALASLNLMARICVRGNFKLDDVARKASGMEDNLIMCGGDGFYFLHSRPEKRERRSS